MKKSIRICFLCFLAVGFSQNLKAQIPEMVFDPTAAGHLVTLGTTLNELHNIQRDVQEAMKDVQWLKDLKSVRDLLVVMESTVCTYQSLKVLLGQRNVVYTGCLSNFRLTMTTIRLNAAIDQATSMLSSSMTQGERLAALHHAMTDFSSAQEDFVAMKRQIMLSMKTEKNRKSFAKNLAGY
jgi:hypothetical protein